MSNTIAILGLGTMGGGMAGNLLKAGFSLTVYNRTAAKAKALVEQWRAACIHAGGSCRGSIDRHRNAGGRRGVARNLDRQEWRTRRRSTGLHPD